MESGSRSGKLKEIALLFLKLGTVSFGGPAAHIAIMEKEVVNKRQWLTSSNFIELMAITNLIPGPNSTQMAFQCGYRRAGAAGLLVAGICFILPAAVITCIIAYFYKAYGSLPAIAPIFQGIQPVVVAIIFDAVIKFGKKTLINWKLTLIGLATVVCSLYGISSIVLLFAAGGLYVVTALGMKRNLSSLFPLLLAQSPALLPSYSVTKLFFLFLKTGSILFGGGMVLFAYMNGDLVDHLHWLSRQQLMDSVAAGQFTPGPILSAATFIGYQVGGISGAIASTVGIFLPSFILVWLLTPFLHRLGSNKTLSSFLAGVSIASVALMLAVCMQMSNTSLVDWKTWSLMILALACLLTFRKVSSVWFILGGALFGYLFSIT